MHIRLVVIKGRSEPGFKVKTDTRGMTCSTIIANSTMKKRSTRHEVFLLVKLSRLFGA